MLLRAPLHVLIVDDSIDDVELLLRELRRQYDVMHAHVATAAGLREALARPWDIVISDWSMPGFGGLEAYAIVREVAPEMPFIILSGVIGEEDAVQALKAGVHDFLSKGKLARLLPAIDRELREAEVRRRDREAEVTLALQRERTARSEAMHRAMFEHSPMPMWTFERETLRFLAVNEAAIHHYGYTREEFLAMTIRDIRPPEDVPALKTLDGRVHGERWRHRKKDGTIIHVEITANDLVVEDGPRVRLVLINDVTDRVRAEEALQRTEEQLRQAQKMEAIGLLAGGVAHDFNNILTVIQSYACLLEESLDDADPRRVDAGEVRVASERAAQLTRQLLTMSRSTVAQPRSINVRGVVDDMVPMMRRMLGERIHIDVRHDDLPSVLADPGQLEQVLMNLAVNARDAMPDGGRLTIETHALELDAEAAKLRGLEAGRFVELAVTDTGTGMNEDVRARIFDPFFTTKDLGKGTGLGLAIVHGIVTQAGGTVTVYSEPGHGTTFRVHLPVATGAVAAPAASPVVEAPRRFPGVTVLLVDDDAGVRALLTRVLQDAGCHALEAASAEEARRLCVDHDRAIDAAIIDVVLPDARGDVLGTELRALRPGLRTLLMSGYPAGALTSSGRAAMHLLTKPFSPAEVRTLLARVLELHTSEPAERRPAPTTDGWRVLIVDDDAHVRAMLVRALRHTGIEVAEADSVRGALDQLEPMAFDAVISDVHMPDGTGLDLLSELRRRQPDLPVILMSGQPDFESAAMAIQFGAFRYLTKPVDRAELARVAQQAARAQAFARLRREALAATGRQVVPADRLELARGFESALATAWMAFQPIVTARGEARFAVEALLRCSEPAMPHPGAILDAATTLGRLPEVGRRVRALCAEALASRPDLTMFVNVHPRDLEDPDLVDEAAPLSALAPRVVLEITERATLRLSPALTVTLARLRSFGYRIAVDDIGAGYSGLATFAELTPEIVKIDMSLVRDVHLSPIKLQTLSALTSLCKELGTLVVAEGVESLAERDCLVDLGCDLLQGFLFGRPERGLP